MIAIRVVPLALGLVLLAASPVLAHPPGVTERVSVSPSGAGGDADSQLPAISGNGRYVAFWSFASNLVPGDTNGTSDVFVRDRSTGVTERVSVTSKGRQAVGGDAGGVLDTNFGRPVITADGRYVAWASSATNLGKSDRNNAVDIFLRDRTAGTTERVTMGTRKAEPDGESSHPAISPDGRFVALQSFADNLVPGDTNFTSDVFRIDRQTGAVIRVSLTSAGQQADNSSAAPSISANGQLVAFQSSSALLPGEPEDSADDVYVRDVQAATTEGISNFGTQLLGHSGAATITPDGRLVAFDSSDDGLVPGDSNNGFDIFVHDRTTHALERVSLNSAGQQGNDWSLSPSISDDGRFVAFASLASNELQPVAERRRQSRGVRVRSRPGTRRHRLPGRRLHARRAIAARLTDAAGRDEAPRRRSSSGRSLRPHIHRAPRARYCASHPTSSPRSRSLTIARIRRVGKDSEGGSE